MLIFFSFPWEAANLMGNSLSSKPALPLSGPQFHPASQHGATLAWVFSGYYEEKIICVYGKGLCLLCCPHIGGCNQALTKPVRWIFFPLNCCSIFPEGHLPPQATFSLLLSTVKLTCLEHKGAQLLQSVRAVCNTYIRAKYTGKECQRIPLIIHNNV